MGTKVSSVLKRKGHDVVTVTPRQTIASVVEVLTQNRVGAAPVVNEEGQLIGIISDRSGYLGCKNFCVHDRGSRRSTA